MITYEQFIANVQEGDLAMLTEFIQSKRITTRDAADGERLFAQATRLFQAGLVWRVVRGYQQIDPDTIEYTFDGFTHPVAAGYIAKACRERVIISRDPLPAT